MFKCDYFLVLVVILLIVPIYCFFFHKATITWCWNRETIDEPLEMLFLDLQSNSEVWDFMLQVRPSVTFMISEPCSCCHGTGRVEALETLFSKIEHEISRLLVSEMSTSLFFLGKFQKSAICLVFKYYNCIFHALKGYSILCFSVMYAFHVEDLTKY